MVNPVYINKHTEKRLSIWNVHLTCSANIVQLAYKYVCMDICWDFHWTSAYQTENLLNV